MRGYFFLWAGTENVEHGPHIICRDCILSKEFPVSTQNTVLESKNKGKGENVIFSPSSAMIKNFLKKKLCYKNAGMQSFQPVKNVGNSDVWLCGPDATASLQMPTMVSIWRLRGLPIFRLVRKKINKKKTITQQQEEADTKPEKLPFYLHQTAISTANTTNWIMSDYCSTIS